MAEPPTNWNQSEEENSSLSSATNKLGALNVNAMEFVPCFGSGFSQAPTITQPVVSTTSLLTSGVIRNTTEDEKKQAEVIQTDKFNIQQQQVKEPTTTVEPIELDDVTDEDRERVIDETTTVSTSITTATTNKTNAASVSVVPKEKKNVVKRDIVRKKEPLNIIFCGHVDAGKSTIGGQLMFLTRQVDKRTLEKYRNEAREKSRESWYLSWALDTNEEERDRGITVEVGRAWFETEKKHFIILDAPGHKCFVPNMIGGAAQSDIAILVISARKGEFETGFERGGQTREHAMLVKTAGVRYLVVLINKMDDPTVNWDQARYDEIRDKLTPYLKKCGFKPGEDTYFMPCSGMTGALLNEHPGEKILPWFKGPTFIEYLDSLPSFYRNIDGPLRMPIVERYREMGVIVMGKIESGCCRTGDRCLLMPNRTRVEVTNIYYEDIETDSCVCGENVRLKLKNVEEEEISSGFILCDIEQEPCGVGRVFDAQVIDQFFDYLLQLKKRNDNQQHRIRIEPRLTSKIVADIESVCSLDYTSSHINWAIVKTTEEKNKFQVKQWNSLEIDLDRKYNFFRTFSQLVDGLSTIPLKDANVLLVEETTYRYSNLKLATYVSQLQQIRAIFNTLLHCHPLFERPVYHISGRDVALHLGLFIGNEQSSAEFFLTNLIFNNTENNKKISLDIDHQLKINYHRTTIGQREPMAQCLLRALTFLQYNNEKKYSSLHSK
ncbi:unnamed protein product [Rotaria socialis]|uniref:Tr-type G domain-containing protein n=1 Tax=Rotaria socialis TaxID=392032 RepID=A0A819VES1_9BILA|nr:unnamed protein product [Rotaria socialis]